MNIWEYITNLFCGSCHEELEACRVKFRDCQGLSRIQAAEIRNLVEENRQLKLLVPREPPPEIDYIIEKDTAWVQSQLVAVAPSIVRLTLDPKYRLTNETNIRKILDWLTTDGFEYVRTWFDCENFAFHTKSETDLYFHINSIGLVIDYAAGHSYNVVVLANGTVKIIEPQSDGMWKWSEAPDKFYGREGAIVLI